MLALSSYLPSRETCAKWAFYGTAAYFIYQSGAIELIACSFIPSDRKMPLPTLTRTISSLPTLTFKATPSLLPRPPFEPLGAVYPQTYEEAMYGIECPTEDLSPFQALYSFVDVLGRRICFNAKGLALKAMQAFQREAVELTLDTSKNAIGYAQGVASRLGIAPP